MKNRESPPAKPSIEEAPKLELKALPPHLRYEFLENGDTFSVIIASDVNEQQVESLVKVLKGSKELLGGLLQTLLGSLLVFFSHKIQLMPHQKPSIDHQRRLNPPMQKVVRRRSLIG